MIFIIMLFAFLILDINNHHKMSMPYIFIKSCAVGFVLFFSLMSANIINFEQVIMLSTSVIAINFFVCLLVNLHIFVVYKLGKVTNMVVISSYTIGYGLVFMAIEYLKAI